MNSLYILWNQDTAIVFSFQDRQAYKKKYRINKTKSQAVY